MGIYAEESASKVPETSTQRNDEPIKIAEETKDLALMELVEEDFENEIDSKKEQAEKNRLAALAKLAARKKEREEAQRLEEEARVAAMIAESGHLFFE